MNSKDRQQQLLCLALSDKDKEIEQLKNQIEKMKCCENCKHWEDSDCQSELTFDCKHWNCLNEFDYWELKK